MIETQARLLPRVEQDIDDALLQVENAFSSGIQYEPQTTLSDYDILAETRLLVDVQTSLRVGPFVEGSYATKLVGRPNEWVVTQDGAALPGDNTYGINNPLEMRAWHAPNADEEARLIMEKGRRPDLALSPTKEATVKEAKESNFMFVQLYGRRGENHGGDTGTVACLSTGLSWDRQTPMEDCAREIARRIAGDPEAPIVWFGPHKGLVVVRGRQSPEEMAKRLVESPREAYNKYMPHLAKAQNAIQDERQETILGPAGKGKDFAAYFRGEEKPLERAFKEDGGLGMAWKYEQRGEDLVGVNPDNKEQTMMSLAENGYDQDIDMKNKLYAANTNINQPHEDNTYVIEFNFDPTATCCGFSSNAQEVNTVQENSAWAGGDFQQAYTAMNSRFETQYVFVESEKESRCTEKNKCDKGKCSHIKQKKQREQELVADAV